MFCLKYGEAIPDGSNVCPICRANLSTESDLKKSFIGVIVAAIVTAIIGIKGSFIKKGVLKKIILVEDIFYMISTIVPLFHMMDLLKEFDSSLSKTGIGIGCYLYYFNSSDSTRTNLNIILYFLTCSMRHFIVSASSNAK